MSFPQRWRMRQKESREERHSRTAPLRARLPLPPPSTRRTLSREEKPYFRHALPVAEALRRLGEGGEYRLALFGDEFGAQPGGEIALVGEKGDMQTVRRPRGGVARKAAL